MGRTKLTTEHFIAESREKHGDFYDYSKSVYTGGHNFLRITCPSHGEFEQRASDHMNVGKGCKLCGTERAAKPLTFTTEDFRIKAKEKHDNFYDYSLSDYTTYKKPITIICPVHGEFSQVAGKHLKGYGCIKCGRNKPNPRNTKTPEEWIEGFREVHGERFDYSEALPILKSTDRVSIRCKDHGIFVQAAMTHQAGHGCPNCPCCQSRPETEIYEWLQQIIPEASILRSDRRLIAPFELDLYIPESRVAIEFNGSYWHSEDKMEVDYHQKKTLMCQEKGVTLIHVYEYDWESKKEHYKNIIAAKACANTRKLDARKLQIRETPHYRDFLNSNHFQGNVVSSKQYGLFSGDELVALMTFGKPRYTDNHKWELLRFCSASGTRVRGGASRLFKHFACKHLLPGETVISYARMDYSTGAVYDKLGFTLDGMSDPGYVWTHKNASRSYLPRYATQKHKLESILGSKFDSTRSEASNMRKAGYRRVYTAGNLRYIYVHGDT